MRKIQTEILILTQISYQLESNIKSLGDNILGIFSCFTNPKMTWRSFSYVNETQKENRMRNHEFKPNSRLEFVNDENNSVFRLGCVYYTQCLYYLIFGGGANTIGKNRRLWRINAYNLHILCSTNHSICVCFVYFCSVWNWLAVNCF